MKRTVEQAGSNYRAITLAVLTGLAMFAAWTSLHAVAAEKKKPEEAKDAATESATPESKADKKSDKSAAGIAFFESKIRPVLVGKCYQCHSAESKELKGGLSLDTRNGIRKGGDSGAAVVPRDPKGSLLIEALRGEGLEMPPDEPLGETVVDDFVKWIEMGAPDLRDGKAVVRKIDLAEGRKHWAYQPLVAAKPPTVKDKSWPKSDVDRYILAALDAKELKPVADADPATLLRRVTLDLTGLQPTPEELADFLRDPSPKAYAAAVDRLLATTQFGERWGRHWLDVARFAESTGKERNIPYPVAWRYRDYVIDSINADKPYDRFVTEQVAGDLLPYESPEQHNTQLIATGFLAIGPKSVNETNQELFKLDIADEQIDVVCRSIMATTASCARCHDHKFDPIPQTDYYALAGIFRSTDVLAGLQRKAKNYVASQLLPLDSTDGLIAKADAADSNDSVELQSLKTELADLDRKMDKLRGEKDKLDKDSKEARALKEKGSKLLAESKRLSEKIADLEPKPKDEKQAKNVKKYGSSEVGDLTHIAIGVQEGRVEDCAVRIRGEVGDLGPEVPRGFLSVLKNSKTPKIDPEHSGRLELARWLTANDNPLTARVLANRIWFHLFGAGLVESIDNFGALGEKPSHPELLDSLARYVMDHDWSLKQTIRAIVLSRTYQLSSAHDDANYAVDPQNRLVWRMNRRRLDAEVIRDTTMAAAGTLDLSRPEGSPLMERNGEIGRSINDNVLRGKGTSRSVYLTAARGATPEMLGIFDVADSSLVVGQREVTTVATQALFMLNSPFMQDQCDATAQRVLAHQASDDAARIDYAYRVILARPATAKEQTRGAEFVRSFDTGSKQDDKKEAAAWSSFCQVLFSSAEFRYAY